MLEAKTITPEILRNEVQARKDAGQRFVTMSCVELDADTVEIFYHFDKELELEHLKLATPKTITLPSISGIYFAAFLIENEIKDQFGLDFDGLVLDFGGTLYQEKEAGRTPFCRFSVRQAGEEG